MSTLTVLVLRQAQHERFGCPGWWHARAYDNGPRQRIRDADLRGGQRGAAALFARRLRYRAIGAVLGAAGRAPPRDRAAAAGIRRINRLRAVARYPRPDLLRARSAGRARAARRSADRPFAGRNDRGRAGGGAAGALQRAGADRTAGAVESGLSGG